MTTNPILPGFNPDPSICRVGDDFYIATSTFEWFPGVQIYHSRDLRHWKLIHRPLDEVRLLDLQGVQSSAGIWAPCLTWHDDQFYLVYTAVSTWRGETPQDWGAFKDTPNYVVTAPSIAGPWSDPVFLNASGFDPSLFHDDDGRSWLVNMEWDYRNRNTFFSGIVIQEYDRRARSLIGPMRKIYDGTSIGITEGPHLYRREGWYYLMTAEGGTSYAHAVSMARSRSLFGPYENQPGNPVCTSVPDRSVLAQIHADADPKDLPSDFYQRPQKAGHGSWVPLDGDDAVLVHLCARPHPGTLVCTLGRETALERAVWRDGWLRLVTPDGELTNVAGARVDLSRSSLVSPDPWTEEPYLEGLHDGQRLDWSFRDDFDRPRWHKEFRSLRGPLGDDATLSAQPGRLRLFGRQGLISTFHQSVLMTSVKAHRSEASLSFEFQPQTHHALAGLLVRYDERNQHYLFRSFDPERGCDVVGVLSFVKGAFRFPPVEEMAEVKTSQLRFHANLDGLKLQFSWAPEGDALRPVGGPLDLSSLSDEGAWPMGFTGLFAGPACHDLSGQRRWADFDWFEYRERH